MFRNKNKEDRYIELLLQTIRDQKNTIDHLLSMNRDVIYEIRDLTKQISKYVEQGEANGYKNKSNRNK